MPVEWRCGVCEKECLNGTIFCQKCDCWFHAKCEGLSKTHFSELDGSILDYICKGCCSGRDGTFDFSAALAHLSATSGLSRVEAATRREKILMRDVHCDIHMIQGKWGQISVTIVELGIPRARTSPETVYFGEGSQRRKLFVKEGRKILRWKKSQQRVDSHSSHLLINSTTTPGRAPGNTATLCNFENLQWIPSAYNMDRLITIACRIYTTCCCSGGICRIHCMAIAKCPDVTISVNQQQWWRR